MVYSTADTSTTIIKNPILIYRGIISDVNGIVDVVESFHRRQTKQICSGVIRRYFTRTGERLTVGYQCYTGEDWRR
jgi:hypothetical protein